MTTIYSAWLSAQTHCPASISLSLPVAIMLARCVGRSSAALSVVSGAVARPALRACVAVAPAGVNTVPSRRWMSEDIVTRACSTPGLGCARPIVSRACSRLWFAGCVLLWLPTGTIGLTADQEALLDAAEDFSANEFAPYAAEWDANKTFPEEALRAAAELGFAGAALPCVVVAGSPCSVCG